MDNISCPFRTKKDIQQYKSPFIDLQMSHLAPYYKIANFRNTAQWASNAKWDQ